MSCPKNPKKFLFLKFNGGHDMQHNNIKAMMTDHMYEVEYECQLCKVQAKTFVHETTLVEQGYDPRKLQKMSAWDRPHFGKSPEDLK